MNDFEFRFLEVGPVGLLQGLGSLLVTKLRLLWWALDLRLYVEVALDEVLVKLEAHCSD